VFKKTAKQNTEYVTIITAMAILQTRRPVVNTVTTFPLQMRIY